MIIVNTYRELEQYYTGFSKGMIGLLVIESRGGLGKTSLANKIMKDREHGWISAHCTPLSLYKTSYHKKNQPLVFDDVDELLSSKVSVSLLKQLCESKDVKELSYYSTAHQSEDVPQRFSTSSKVLILTNHIKKLGANIQALLDRAHMISFNPNNKEIIKYIKENLQVNEESNMLY